MLSGTLAGKVGRVFVAIVLLAISMTSCSHQDSVVDTTDSLVGRTLTAELRADVFSIVRSDFSEWVVERGRLPDSIEELRQFHGGSEDVLLDPLPFADQLVYAPINERFGLVYSIGYDGVDDGGKIIYDPDSDDIMIETHGVVLEVMVGDRPASQIENLHPIRGDLVLALAVVNDASTGTPRLSLTWLNPARDWYSKSIMSHEPPDGTGSNGDLFRLATPRE